MARINWPYFLPDLPQIIPKDISWDRNNFVHHYILYGWEKAERSSWRTPNP